MHEWVTGRDLAPGRDDRTIEGLVDEFVGSDRNVKTLIREILRTDGFTIGW